MKRLRFLSVILVFACLFAFTITACGGSKPPINSPESGDTSYEDIGETGGETEGEGGDSQGDYMTIQVKIGANIFEAELADTTAATEFYALLPMTLSMSELNGNEKYNYLSSSLTTNSEQVGQIESGDIMLYGSSCVVLFYETFSTSYSYTRLGRITRPTNLKNILSSGGVTVEFSK